MAGPTARKGQHKRLDFIDPNEGEIKKNPEAYGVKKSMNNFVNYTPQEQLQRLNYWLKGMTEAKPMAELIKGFMEEYGAKTKQVCMYWRNRALEYLTSTQDKDIEHFRAVQQERLTDLYKRCLEANQLKTAESVLDTLNKLMGVYKQDNIIVAPVTQFNFGDEKITAVDNTSGQAENILNYFTTAQLEEEDGI